MFFKYVPHIVTYTGHLNFIWESVTSTVIGTRNLKVLNKLKEGINTVWCPIKVNGITIELILHTFCY